MITLNLTADEAHLVTEALLAYISDFGHDEADILHHARQVLAKVEGAANAPAVTVGTPSTP
ncbi:MAG TPA: hypothetical protein VFD94_09310 [Jatrophihabitans sp.]|jgi:hypothetical protein|nr:hypothetical protein [Jatrophihabitans sp.]